MARLVEFAFLAVSFGILVLALIVGANYSVWLGLGLLLLASASLFYLVYNFDYWFVRQLTRFEPQILLQLCETGAVGRLRNLVGRLPSNPRCRLCKVPFGGVGALLKIKPARKNANFCRSCFEGLPTATIEMEVGILCADIRGYTAWTETHSAGEAADALSRFYAIADRELTRDDAFVEFVGDQVMAIYLTIMPSLSGRVAGVMVDAARRLVDAVDADASALPVGVAVNFGLCEVGNVRKGAAKDFTAIGDTVNTAARLQTNAEPGQVIISESVYARLNAAPEGAREAIFSAKGKEAPLRAWVVEKGTA